MPPVSMALHRHFAPASDQKPPTRARNDQPSPPRTARTEPPLGWPAGIASGLVDLPSEAPRSQLLGIISEYPKLLQTHRSARSQQTHDEKNATERRRLSACKNTLMDEPGV
ncbi:hypothetical protein NM208_g6568 [Fusarium decemcellulare]|uniref:Uncharacterized protein n=1 Tax=Fusarium decemcellulare TaxID=57161 RepID=A0ACC1SCT7_9HYPO|nr:hypothetical protein NM208_g6568 [Fusarium decemcellulare]